MREHYLHRSARRKRERKAVLKALAPFTPPKEARPAIVTFTRFGPRSLDDDNLSGAFKAPRDAVAGWLGQTDAADSPIVWKYAQAQVRDPQLTKGGRTRYRVWFEIDITWDVDAPAAEPLERPLEGVQVPGLDPPVRCIRRIPWATATGDVLARVPHLQPGRQTRKHASELVVARKEFQGKSYLAAAVHFETGGKKFRTLGLAVYSEAELRALRDAADAMLREASGAL